MLPLRALVASCPAANGALNFARDDALLGAVRESGMLVARTYSWTSPVVSFGRNERTAGWYSRERARSKGIEVVRRRTGGRALVHFRELTYAIAGPASVADTVTSTYMQIADVLVAALRYLKIRAEISAGSREENAEGAPCFATITRGEITADGRKLAASAQWRGEGAFLQHGSIMIEDWQGLLNTIVEDDRALPFGDAITLCELMPRPYPNAEEFADALAVALNDRAGVATERVAPGLIMDEAIVRNRARHFEDSAWTWRR